MEANALLALRQELEHIGETHRRLNDRAVEIVSAVLREREKHEAVAALKTTMMPVAAAAKILQVSKITVIRWGQDAGVARQHGKPWFVPKAWVRERVAQAAQ